MLCIQLNNTDPYFCLAAEEYFLKNFRDDIFMVWRSDNAVVTGKHQNALGEVDYRYVLENNIHICRRISGGGTVYHDAGNVNFTYIKNVKSPSEISFRQFTQPVANALELLGLTVTTSGRNDLLINGLKISGNAEHVFKNRVMHHGTLLFQSDLDLLGNAIRVTPGKYISKAVQSNRSRVANIIQFLDREMSTSAFIHFLMDVQLKNRENQVYIPKEADFQAIEKLSVEKFRTWEWNFGYSPKYTFLHHPDSGENNFQTALQVEKGIIVEARVQGNMYTEEFYRSLSGALEQKRHSYDEILDVLRNSGAEDPEETAYLFF